MNGNTFTKRVRSLILTYSKIAVAGISTVLLAVGFRGFFSILSMRGFLHEHSLVAFFITLGQFLVIVFLTAISLLLLFVLLILLIGFSQGEWKRFELGFSK